MCGVCKHIYVDGGSQVWSCKDGEVPTTAHRKHFLTSIRAIFAPGKGILATDESTASIVYFDSIGVENTLENRRNYRELLITTPQLEDHISGIILYEETLFQNARNGTPFVELLQAKGILAGVKADDGFSQIAGTLGELATIGLDDLDERCTRYAKQGARFTKWRCVFKIQDCIGATPSQLAILENSITLARFASISQQHGLVPIVEPEVLMDGDFPAEITSIVTERVLSSVVKALLDHHVFLEGTILKPNMIRSGSDSVVQIGAKEIGALTLRTLQRTVPVALPGIAFLSGGLSEEQASLALSEINKSPGNKPWKLSFSFGRALQQSCLHAWMGRDENIAAAQAALMERARANSLASLGQYEGGVGGTFSVQSNFVRNYIY